MKEIMAYIYPYLELIFKIILCIILTGIVGYNREKKGMTVGIRTHVLVGLSAVMLQVISIEYIENYNYQGDIFRLGGQMLSGIGFLGAGAIIKEHKNIHGLTTAASIFFVACVGLTVGVGMYIPAVLVTIAAYAFLIDIFGFKKIILTKKANFITLGIEINGPYQRCSKAIMDTLDGMNVEINSVKVTVVTMEKTKVILKLNIADDIIVNDILASISEIGPIVKTEVIGK